MFLDGNTLRYLHATTQKFIKGRVVPATTGTVGETYFNSSIPALKVRRENDAVEFPCFPKKSNQNVLNGTLITTPKGLAISYENQWYSFSVTSFKFRATRTNTGTTAVDSIVFQLSYGGESRTVTLLTDGSEKLVTVPFAPGEVANISAVSMGSGKVKTTSFTPVEFDTATVHAQLSSSELGSVSTVCTRYEDNILYSSAIETYQGKVVTHFATTPTETDVSNLYVSYLTSSAYVADMETAGQAAVTVALVINGVQVDPGVPFKVDTSGNYTFHLTSISSPSYSKYGNVSLNAGNRYTFNINASPAVFFNPEIGGASEYGTRVTSVVQMSEIETVCAETEEVDTRRIVYVLDLGVTHA